MDGPGDRPRTGNLSSLQHLTLQSYPGVDIMALEASDVPGYGPKSQVLWMSRFSRTHTVHTFTCPCPLTRTV